MKRPDLRQIAARGRTLLKAFGEWLKASRPRAWVVFVASVLATMAIEDLAIYLGARGLLHTFFGLPTLCAAACAGYFATQGIRKRWRALLAFAVFVLALGPTSADLVREAQIVLLAILVCFLGVGAIWLLRGKPKTIKRTSASHFTSLGVPKKKFTTEAEARVAANALSARDGAAMNTYVCGTCHKFHVGHAK